MNGNFSNDTVSFLRNLLTANTLPSCSAIQEDALELYVTARTLQRRRDMAAAQRSKPPKNSVKITLGDGPNAPTATLTREQYNKVDDLLAQGKPIYAIRELRDIVNFGFNANLRDCKLACQNRENFPVNFYVPPSSYGTF